MKRFTPCTTVSASPKSECGHCETESTGEKKRILKQYEDKVFMLFSMVDKKKRQVLRRAHKLEKHSKTKSGRERTPSRVTQDRNWCATTREKKVDYIDYSVEEAKNNELERIITRLELSNNAANEELNNAKAMVEAEKLLIVELEQNVSENHKSLLKAYCRCQDYSKQLCRLTEERIHAQDRFQSIMACANKFALESKKVMKRQPTLLNIKNKSTEARRKTEAKYKIVEHMKASLNNVNTDINITTSTFEKFKEKYEQIVSRIKGKIPALEFLIEKLETQGVLQKLRKNRLQSESFAIFKKSKEILEYLRVLSQQISATDGEMENSLGRFKELQQKIIDCKELKEKEERLAYLRSRVHKK